MNNGTKGKKKTQMMVYKIGDALIQHMLCRQESGLAEILSHLPQYIFCKRTRG